MRVSKKFIKEMLCEFAKQLTEAKDVPQENIDDALEAITEFDKNPELTEDNRWYVVNAMSALLVDMCDEVDINVICSVGEEIKLSDQMATMNMNPRWAGRESTLPMLILHLLGEPQLESVRKTVEGIIKRH